MGGFRFNGCGVTDHFKHIKSLGIHICPKCNKLSEFTLDEANQKIDVFWIPTLTLKSRYAVMCKKCKAGEFCSVEWAGYLMNQAAGQEVIFESVAKERTSHTNTFQKPIQTDTPENINGISQKESVLQPGTEEKSGIPRFFTCSNCGVTQMREGNFCSYCGNPIPVHEPVEQDSSSNVGVTCPSCGSEQEAGVKFCGMCGQLITPEPSRGKYCPLCGAKAVEGSLFCGECGSRLT